jgi:predicted nucleic acid-binding protein
MADGLTLDTGALIAAEKRDRHLWSVLKEASVRRATITVPTVVLAQTWRGNSPMIARLLPACVVEDLDELAAKRVGVLLSKSRRRPDVVDAAVVIGAGLRGDAIVTSDADDINRLVAENGVQLPIISV